MSDPSHRKHFYPIAVVVTALSGVVLWLLGAPGSVARGTATSVALLIIASIISRWSKISLHTSFNMFSAVVLLAVNQWVGVVALVLAMAVAWSRVHLSRHTLVQVLSGALLGTACGIIALWPIPAL